MNAAEMKAYVEANPRLVSKKETSNPDLFVLKYQRRVFFDSLWNEFLEECRGTIVDKDYNVIARPFTKIYNYGIEDAAPKLDPSTKVTAYRKVNGFMASLTWYNGDILVSTTGSIDSDFVGYIKEMMQLESLWDNWKSHIQAFAGYTLMFECVHPSDPHIVPEIQGMYFLGMRKNTWDSTVDGYGKDVADKWRYMAENLFNCEFAEPIYTTVGDLVETSKKVKHEGFVAYTECGESFKIKSPFYLATKAMARKKDIMNLNKQFVDEEFYPLLEHLRANQDFFNALDEQAKLSCIRSFLGE